MSEVALVCGKASSVKAVLDAALDNAVVKNTHYHREHFGYTKSYLSRYFSASFGVGFCQYLSAIRLKNALTLMNERKRSITECALDSGFNSMRSFYRVFQSEFGCSPREYISESEKNNSLEKIERK